MEILMFGFFIIISSKRFSMGCVKLMDIAGCYVFTVRSKLNLSLLCFSGVKEDSVSDLSLVS